MRKCPFCEKEFKSTSPHIYTCSDLDDKVQVYKI